MRCWVFLLLLLPSLASAKVFMCVDEATGQTSFTDKGCSTTALRQEVRVPPANAVSGGRMESKPESRKRVWASDIDNRKTGRDYRQEERRLRESLPTASIDAGGSYGGI